VSRCSHGRDAGVGLGDAHANMRNYGYGGLPLKTDVKKISAIRRRSCYLVGLAGIRKFAWESPLLHDRPASIHSKGEFGFFERLAC
jgi:hypothetical protein